MERKSLYELMNNQIEKLSLNSSFKKLEDFITNDKNSILFIQSLSSVFEVEDIDNIYGISQARARHSAITFLMGMVFSEFGDLYNEISNIVDLDEAYKQKIWLLTSLNHDRGYFSKYLSRKDVNYKKICKYYLFDESNETTLLKCTSNFQEKYKNTLAYTFEEILLYDEFARDFHERDESEEKVDHGILGGIITYDSLIKKIEKASYDENAVIMAKATGVSIAQHNIFKSQSKEDDKLYPEKLLEKLKYNSEFRIDRKTPLLLLLSLVDTIECVKKYGKKGAKNSDDNRYLETITILKLINIGVDKDRIEFDLSKLGSQLIKKGFFEDYVKSYWNSILGLSKWTEFIVSEENSVFYITMKE